MFIRPPEGRKTAQLWMRRQAELLFCADDKGLRCVVHDMSDSGARIRLETRMNELPPSFTFALLKSGLQRNCNMVWTDGRFVGTTITPEWSGASLAWTAPGQKGA
jgi:hypothetical protein